MARLAVLDRGHPPDVTAEIARMREENGFVSEVLTMLMYRPELFGRPFSEALEDVMRGPSDWSVGERELFAAFVSSLNQCPF
jgi:hypothetical protein